LHQNRTDDKIEEGDTSFVNLKDKLASNSRYRERLEQFGPTIQALASGAHERRLVRYGVLADVGQLNGASILDLGCGLADFYEYLCSRGIHPKYTGYDISPDLIARATARFPKVEFETRDIQRDGIPREFDYILSSQAFNYRLKHEENLEMVKDILRRCLDKARKAVACDFLSSYVDYREEHLYYYSPEEMLRYCKTLTKRVLLRHDYPLFEFTIYLYPDFQGWNADRHS